MIDVVVCAIIAAAVTLVLYVVAPLDEHKGTRCRDRRPAPESVPPLTSMPLVVFGHAEPAEDNPPAGWEEIAASIIAARQETSAGVAAESAAQAAEPARSGESPAPDPQIPGAGLAPDALPRPDGVIRVSMTGHVSVHPYPAGHPPWATAAQPAIGPLSGPVGNPYPPLPDPLPEPVALVRPFLYQGLEAVK
jgi:hypothetical protein